VRSFIFFGIKAEDFDFNLHGCHLF
jgi:hypothetical protein